MKFTRRSLFTYLSTIPFIGLFFQSHAQAATITDITAARVITDLLKDRTVANATPYDAGSDLATAVLVTKYATAFWTVYKGVDNFTPGTPVPSPTNSQLAAFYLRKLKHHCIAVYEQSVVVPTSEAAAATAKATVAAETTADLGAP